MGVQRNRSDILIVEYDDVDYELILEALKVIGLNNRVLRAIDGAEALDLVLNPGNARIKDFQPGFMILDLNMPRKNGWDVLKEMKLNPRSRQLPIIVLATSVDQDDVVKCYELGVNSFIQKPVRFQDLVEIFDTVVKYWLEVVKLPKRDGRA